VQCVLKVCDLFHVLQEKMLRKLCIIVSYYARDNADKLLELLTAINGHGCNLIVVENIDAGSASSLPQLDIEVIQNRNCGMNIGAWNSGFVRNKNYDAYLFLQDECFLKKSGFVHAILDRLNRDRDIGMLGETINRKWAHSWQELRNSKLNSFEADHTIAGAPARRVDTYLAAMHAWGVPPGSSGEHLRALIWAFPGNAMRKMGGFPVGRNKGECIAAEIAVSRKIIAMGLRFDQIEQEPFSYFGHIEWRSDGLSKR
jgi:hypothetical protein